MHLCPGRNDVAQQRLCPLHVDCEIVINKEDGDLATLALRARLQEQQFVHHALIRAKADGVAEESCHCAELAAIRTASARLDRNDAKSSPAFGYSLKER